MTFGADAVARDTPAEANRDTRWLALLILCLGDLMIVLGDDRRRRAPLDPLGSRLLGGVARLGRQRVPDHLRRLPPARGPAGRPLRAPEPLLGRSRALHGRAGRVRSCGFAGDARRRPRRAGRRRRRRLGPRPLTDDDALHRADRAGTSDGHLRVRRLRRRLARRPARRHPHGHARLALDLPRQHPRRPPGRRPDTGRDLGGPGRDDRAAAGPRWCGDRDGLAHARGPAIVNGNEVGWLTARTLGLLAPSGFLLAIFLGIEARVRTPLVPLRLFRLRNISVSNAVGFLWAGAMFAWFFLSALYLQLVLGFSPLQVGLAFLPGNLIMGAMSIGLSAKLVLRFGIRPPLGVGLGLAAIGLLLLARAPVDGNFATDVLPSMILLGLGAGMAFNPVLLAAMSDVEPTEAGLASGLVNTSFMMGGALGLAVLASLAASRTDVLLADGESQAAALTGGYHVAFRRKAGCVRASCPNAGGRPRARGSRWRAGSVQFAGRQDVPRCRAGRVT